MMRMRMLRLRTGQMPDCKVRWGDNGGTTTAQAQAQA